MSKRKKQTQASMNTNQNQAPSEQPAAESSENAETVVQPTADSPVETPAAVAPAIPDPIPTPTPTPEPTPTPVSKAMDETMIDPKIRNDFQLLNEQFARYVDGMAPSKPVSEDVGAGHQVALWRIIESVLRKEGESFTVLFTQLLTLMAAERKGVLSETRRYRFFGALRLGRDDAGNFQAILSALLTLCNPQDRALRLRQVDLARVFRNYPNKAAEARVIDYFSA